MAASGGAAGSGSDRLWAASAGGDPGNASQPVMQTLVDAIIVLGHLPSQSRSSSTEEKRLAVRLIKARKARTLTWQQEAQLDNLMPEQKAELERGQRTEELLQQLHDFGLYPKAYAGRSLAERQLAEKFRRARKAK